MGHPKTRAAKKKTKIPKRGGSTGESGTVTTEFRVCVCLWCGVCGGGGVSSCHAWPYSSGHRPSHPQQCRDRAGQVGARCRSLIFMFPRPPLAPSTPKSSAVFHQVQGNEASPLSLSWPTVTPLCPWCQMTALVSRSKKKISTQGPWVCFPLCLRESKQRNDTQHKQTYIHPDLSKTRALLGVGNPQLAQLEAFQP